MQTDLGSQIDARTVTASYLYAARYRYSDTVLSNDNQLRIFPREGEGQSPVKTRLWTLPEGRGVEYADRFGNSVRRVRVIEHHSTLIVATAGQVRLTTELPDPGDVYLEDIGGLTDGFEYTLRSPLVDPESVEVLAMHVAGSSDSLLGRMRAVTDWVYEFIRYKRGTTDVSTTAEQVISAMEGVCQDKTHLALGMLRALGIPCRYVSGLLTGQTGETHSWMEVLHPNDGWIGMDPTRGITLPPAWDYVKLAVGRDYTDVSPINGSFLSKGGSAECAAAASVRFGESEPVLDDALQLLESAYVVKSAVW